MFCTANTAGVGVRTGPASAAAVSVDMSEGWLELPPERWLPKNPPVTAQHQNHKLLLLLLLLLLLMLWWWWWLSLLMVAVVVILCKRHKQLDTGPSSSLAGCRRNVSVLLTAACTNALVQC
jgi:hypothetical protein